MVAYFLDLAVEKEAPQRRLALALRCIVLPMLVAAAEAKQQVLCCCRVSAQVYDTTHCTCYPTVYTSRHSAWLHCQSCPS